MNVAAIDKPTLIKIYEAFKGSRYARPKMLQLLLEQITDGFGKLSTAEQVEFLYLV